MIRSGLMKVVLDVLGAHPYLALEDFQLKEFASRNGEPCLSVTYRYNQKWYFSFHIPTAKKKLGDSISEHYWFTCTMSPGREAAEETINAEERRGLLVEIEDWVKRLYEDIVSAPVVRQFEAHSSALQELKERIEQLPDEPLSRDDMAQFHQDLDHVKAEIAEQLKKEITDKAELKRKIDELGKDIEFLKRAIESLTKRQWGEMLFVRLRKWKFSLRQLASGARVLKSLLPADVSDELDVVADVANGLADVLEKKPQSNGST